MLSSTAFSESLTAIEESNLRPANTLSNADRRNFGLSLRFVFWSSVLALKPFIIPPKIPEDVSCNKLSETNASDINRTF